MSERLNRIKERVLVAKNGNGSGITLISIEDFEWLAEKAEVGEHQDEVIRVLRSDAELLIADNREQFDALVKLSGEIQKHSAENEKLRRELIHYLGELKMFYTRPDSRRFCENKINAIKGLKNEEENE